MRTRSTVERGTVPHQTVNLACARAPRRVRRQETGVMRQEVVVAQVCGVSEKGLHASHRHLRRCMRRSAATFGGGF